MQPDPPAGRCPEGIGQSEENSGASSRSCFFSSWVSYGLLPIRPPQNQALLKLISGIGNKEIPVEGLLAWADLYPVIDKLYDGFIPA